MARRAASAASLGRPFSPSHVALRFGVGLGDRHILQGAIDLQAERRVGEGIDGSGIGRQGAVFGDNDGLQSE